MKKWVNPELMFLYLFVYNSPGYSALRFTDLTDVLVCYRCADSGFASCLLGSNGTT